MNVSWKNKIQDLSKASFLEIKSIREHLHQYPELSFQEHKTMAFVAQKLRDWNISHETGIAGTGIIAFIRGKHDKTAKHVVLRADLDALPIQEQNTTSYVSRVSGIMHACGHDVHTSVLLGAAKILKELEDELDYPIQLIFQPGEELAPGGASLMIAAGALNLSPIEAIFGLHVFPEMEAGKVGFREGLYMASCDELHFVIIGKGGHAALPENCIDPILAGAQLVLGLKKNIEIQKKEGVPYVLSIGHFEALGATNVIPDKAVLKGTFRTMDEEWRSQTLAWIEQYSQSVALETGTKIELRIVKGYPFLINDPDVTKEQRKRAKFLLGEDNVKELDLRMTAEDFSFYSQLFPACFYRLGVRNEEKGIVYGVHHPKFDIDEKALLIGMQMMASTAFKI
jgi:amidohydrolase